MIRTYDSPDTFFYLYPPYVSSSQGQYSGYYLEQSTALLDVCSQIKGGFFVQLSGRDPGPIAFWMENWDHEKTVAVDGKRKAQKKD